MKFVDGIQYGQAANTTKDKSSYCADHDGATGRSWMKQQEQGARKI